MEKLYRLTGFLPYTVMIFLNAFVDLGHKIIIQNTVFKVYDGATQVILTAIVNGLILLPFILLFTPSGMLADKFRKPIIMQYSAIAAVILTLVITLSYYMGWFYLAFSMTFLLAIQSAFYSPAKYGYIRELMGKHNLARGNGVVQAVTIVAILAGTFVFSILFESSLGGEKFTSEADILLAIAPIGWALVLCTLLELIMAYRLPATAEPAKTAPFRVKHYLGGNYLRRNLRILWRDETIWLSIIGLSVFWGISQIVLASYPAFAKETLNITNTIVIQGLLACSGFGIVAGSLLAGRVSSRHIETGLIPVGAIGMVLTLSLLPQLTNTYWLALNILGFGLFGGIFIVPLNALIQFHASREKLGIVLAGNNWIQNVVMLTFLVLTASFAYLGANSELLLHFVTTIAVLGAIYTLWHLPQSLIRYALGLVFKATYRVRIMGFDNIPSTGPVLLLGNHISWLDWAMIQIASPRPVRFVMHRAIYQRWYLKWFLDLFGVIPIGSSSKESLRTINERLRAGDMVCLFPEGSISRSGQLSEFKRGFERCVDDVEGVILPFYLRGLWGSRFSRSSSRMQQLRRSSLRHDVIVAFGAPLPIDSKADVVKSAVFELSIDTWHDYTATLDPIALAWMRTVKQAPSSPCLSDAVGDLNLSRRTALTAALTMSRRIGKCSPEQNIGLLLPTSTPGILANMAALISGKTLVNLNFTANLAALESAIVKAELKTIYTSRRFIKKLERRNIDLSPLFKLAQPVYLEDLKVETSKPEQLAYLAAVTLMPAGMLYRIFGQKQDMGQNAAILFSSGSEGDPKGVMLSHRNIMGNIKQVSDVLDTRENDVVMASLPLFHAFGLTVTGFMPLIEGIPTVCHPDPTDVVSIAHAIAENQATVLCGTSTFLRFFTRNRKVHPVMLESLRVVVAGAERLAPEIRDQFTLKFGKTIYEGYGTTETTPVASVNIPDRLSMDDWQVQIGNKTGTVGMPLPGSSFRIVDPNTLETLPTGEDGLILIGGTQVMSGYLKDPDKTAEAIIELDGRRWYKSGDKGHLDQDGFLTIIDRYSRFAKIGGEMVSLSAIESAFAPALAEDIEILACAVPDGKKGERVVLLYSGETDEAALRQAASSSGMNPLMQPSAYLQIEQIPKLGSGKNDFNSARKIVMEELGTES